MRSNETAHTFSFWQRWLVITSLLFAVAGIAFAFFGDSFIFAPYNSMLAKIFWHADQFPPEVNQFRAFIYAPLGGTVTCCYILLAYIAYYPFKEKKRWARQAIITAFSFWVIIDISACIYFRVYPQIYIINAFSIVVKALPIIFSWKYFTKTAG